jgi:hypothetical protein
MDSSEGLSADGGGSGGGASADERAQAVGPLARDHVERDDALGQEELLHAVVSRPPARARVVGRAKLRLVHSALPQNLDEPDRAAASAVPLGGGVGDLEPGSTVFKEVLDVQVLLQSAVPCGAGGFEVSGHVEAV